MCIETNPFFYQSASDLPNNEILQYYTEGASISKALSSKENCYIVGERGAGKSMALRYHSFSVQRLLPHNDNLINNIGVYVPCNMPLMFKNEVCLYPQPHRSAIIEHLFVISIVYHICETFENSDICNVDVKIQKRFLRDFSYMLSLENNIKFYSNIFKSIKFFLIQQSNYSQQELNKITDGHQVYLFTFFTLVIPMLNILKLMLPDALPHFSLLLDDAHLLSSERQSILNSYVSYRDHTQFSFKVAIASCEDYSFLTTEGTTLVPGHDFTMLNLEEDFQSSRSDFGHFIREIINKRLKEHNIHANADNFFPISKSFERGIKECTEETRRDAISKFGGQSLKKISDYVYKYGRVKYFQERAAKASLPQYSGMDIIAHISTGVVRNALYPCWKMFEKEHYRLDGNTPKSIPPSIQAEILKSESDALWANIRNGFENKIQDCSKKDSKSIENLFNALSRLFRDRLLSRCSEPRVLAFIVSGKHSDEYAEVMRLLKLCKKAQLIYERFGPSKDEGRRETYFVTNRLLWIASGLDPEGQHGRLSIKASDLYAASFCGKPFPSTIGDDLQLELPFE